MRSKLVGIVSRVDVGSVREVTLEPRSAGENLFHGRSECT